MTTIEDEGYGHFYRVSNRRVGHEAVRDEQGWLKVKRTGGYLIKQDVLGHMRDEHTEGSQCQETENRSTWRSEIPIMTFADGDCFQ
jgi:hypothetical protein